MSAQTLTYDVTRDGKRFMIATAGEGGSAPLALVVNWTADLKKYRKLLVLCHGHRSEKFVLVDWLRIGE